MTQQNLAKSAFSLFPRVPPPNHDTAEMQLHEGNEEITTQHSPRRPQETEVVWAAGRGRVSGSPAPNSEKPRRGPGMGGIMGRFLGQAGWWLRRMRRPCLDILLKQGISPVHKVTEGVLTTPTPHTDRERTHARLCRAEAPVGVCRLTAV